MIYKIFFIFLISFLFMGCSNKKAEPKKEEFEKSEKIVAFKKDFEKTLQEMLYFQKKVSFELVNSKDGVKKNNIDTIHDEKEARFKETIMYKAIKSHFEKTK